MPSYTLGPYEQRQYFDANGNPLAGGKIYTYITGSVTPAVTYTNWTGTPAANPIVLDSQGRTRIYLDPLVSYKFVLTDANGVGVGLDMDPISLNIGTVTGDKFLATSRGLVGTPALSFQADTDTGIWSSSANTLDISTAGSQRVRFHPSGGVSIGNTTDPTVGALGVNGAVLAGNGAVGAPAFAFTSDPDTGMYRLGANFFGFAIGGQDILSMTFNSTSILVQMPSLAAGAGAVTGPQLVVGNNTSGGGAAGCLRIKGKGSADNYIWADASAAPGMLRISTLPPEEDGTPSDTSGTVVGLQASWHERKTNITPTAVTPAAALAAVLDATIYDFAYTGDGYQDVDGNKATFTGFVGYDRADWFLMNVGPQQDPALNEITIPGYYALAFKALKQEIDALRAEVAKLKAVF